MNIFSDSIMKLVPVVRFATLKSSLRKAACLGISKSVTDPPAILAALAGHDAVPEFDRSDICLLLKVSSDLFRDIAPSGDVFDATNLKPTFVLPITGISIYRCEVVPPVTAVTVSLPSVTDTVWFAAADNEKSTTALLLVSRLSSDEL